jgi:hypothetical protein
VLKFLREVLWKPARLDGKPRQPRRRKESESVGLFDLGRSIRFTVPRTLLARAFASQGRFCALLLAGLQIERVPLDLLDDVFTRDLSLKALERALQALTFVELNFCQRNSPRFSNSIRHPKRSSFPARAFSVKPSKSAAASSGLTRRSRPADVCLVDVLLEEVPEIALILGQTELSVNCTFVGELNLRGRIEVRNRILPCEDERRATVL